jgi:hypothetical protein
VNSGKNDTKGLGGYNMENNLNEAIKKILVDGYSKEIDKLKNEGELPLGFVVVMCDLDSSGES